MQKSPLLVTLLAVAILLASTAFCIPVEIELRRVDVLKQLGLDNVNSTITAGQLDAVMVLGTSLFTARLGVGTPPQPVNFLLNLVGDSNSPRVGDLSFVLSAASKGNESSAEAAPMDAGILPAFNQSASSTFRARPDITFRTALYPNQLNLNVRGDFGEEVIMFRDNTYYYKNMSLQEGLLGQVEEVDQRGALLRQLTIGGILGLGRRSQVHRKADHGIVLAFGPKYGILALDMDADIKLCARQRTATYLDLVENEGGANADTYRFKLNGVKLILPGIVYDKKDAALAMVSPNSPFLQGPTKVVATLAKISNAAKMRVGRQQFYVIACDEPLGTLTFSTASRQLELDENLLKIKLPPKMLPPGQCLWAIQEHQNEKDDDAFWTFGRPIFDKYCLYLNAVDKKIYFHSMK